MVQCYKFGFNCMLHYKDDFDYGKYSSTLTSAPFDIWILVNALYFVLPALIIFILGIIKKRKNK